MSVGASGIFSVQAVIISLALHVVVVGGLYSLGTSGEKPPAADAPASQPEAFKPVNEQVEMPEVKAQEPAKQNENVPKIEKSGPKREMPKVKPDDNPAQIRIEPRADDKIGSDTSVEQVEAPVKKEDSSPAKTNTGSGRVKLYVVKRGDTLTALAKECGLTVQELATLNGKSVKKLSNLWVGQKIKLPVR